MCPAVKTWMTENGDEPAPQELEAEATLRRENLLDGCGPEDVVEIAVQLVEIPHRAFERLRQDFYVSRIYHQIDVVDEGRVSVQCAR